MPFIEDRHAGACSEYSQWRCESIFRRCRWLSLLEGCSGRQFAKRVNRRGNRYRGHAYQRKELSFDFWNQNFQSVA